MDTLEAAKRRELEAQEQNDQDLVRHAAIERKGTIYTRI